MKKFFICLTVFAFLFVGCALEKELCYVNKSNESVCETYQPYGLYNEQDVRSDKVYYRISVESLVVAVLLSETVVAPVAIACFYLYEPVSIRKDLK